ncbi:MAG: winged helix-turn-helix domain-containing protein, partial [Acidobacteria bacterium]|nr:winged helix-turn-helix domain-containing protein [Acidobacteriota bacterium]
MTYNKAFYEAFYKTRPATTAGPQVPISDIPDKVKFGPFEADLDTRELWKEGIRLKLIGQPFEILAVLVSKPGRLVTREELRARLWPADTFVDFNHGLNAAINRLRDALCDSAENPRYIETLPRRGYRFIASVEALERNEEPRAGGSKAPELTVQGLASIESSLRELDGGLMFGSTMARAAKNAQTFGQRHIWLPLLTPALFLAGVLLFLGLVWFFLAHSHGRRTVGRKPRMPAASPTDLA